MWAVGGITQPVMLHWTGGSWTEVPVDPHCALQGINGVWVEGSDVYFAGHFGDMGKYDGTTWTCPDAPLTPEHFHAVRGHDGGVWWWGGNIFGSGSNYGTVGQLGGAMQPLTVTDCN